MSCLCHVYKIVYVCKHTVYVLQICFIECLVSLGTSVLALVVMPQFDVLTNLFITGGVCIVSSILQIIYRLQKEKWKIIFPICSIALILTGNILFIFPSLSAIELHWLANNLPKQ